MVIWVFKDGQREGPYEEEDLRELVYEGTYTDSLPAIRDGELDWTTLGQILGRQPASAPPSPSSDPEPPPVIPPEPPPIPADASPAESELRISAASPPPVQVAVVDFEMPFGSMVMMMVKWVLASIPALLLLGAIAAIFWITFFALISAILRH